MAPTVIFGRFEWDALKEQENIQKHDVDFYTAVIAFLDPLRIIAVDEKHSVNEERLFCVGRIGNQIATVRFTKRGKQIRIIGAGFWRMGRNFMKRKEKIKDINEPKGKLIPVSDFLPSPEDLLPSEETIKITIALDSDTLKFFKKYADKAGLKYQRIIREVLKGYARKYG